LTATVDVSFNAADFLLLRWGKPNRDLALAF